MIDLAPIKDNSYMLEFIPIESKHYYFLYEILKERDDTINISHYKLPTYEEHVIYWYNIKHKCCYIICDDNIWIGYCYISTQDEIGIFIKNEFQGKKYGYFALKKLISYYSKYNKNLYANINPKNVRSQNLFKKFNFKLIQYTYKMANE